jgi:hypothetical protein
VSNETPNTPGLSETELRETKVDDLREQAKDAGITGTSSMKKDELVDALSEQYRDGGSDDGEAGLPTAAPTTASSAPATRPPSR